MIDEWFNQYLVAAIKSEDYEFAALLVRLQIDFHKYAKRSKETK